MFNREEFNNYMRVLDEPVDVNCPDYIENYRQMTKANFELGDYVEDALKINRKKAVTINNQDKYDARCRINKLMDRGCPFLEIGQLAGCQDGIPSGNIIAGIG